MTKTRLKLVAFDAARYLDNDEAIAEYMTAVLEANDPDLLLAALSDVARAKGMAVIHTQEAHDAQLADCPPSKRARGALSCGIGDPGPLCILLGLGGFAVQVIIAALLYHRIALLRFHYLGVRGVGLIHDFLLVAVIV